MWHFALYKRLIPTCAEDGDKHLKRYLMQLRRNARNVWRIARRSKRLNLAGGVREKKFIEIKNYALCDTCAESSDWSVGLKEFKCERECVWDYFQRVKEEWLKAADEHMLGYLRMLKENANNTIEQRTDYLKKLYRTVKQNYKRDGANKKRYLALRLTYKRNKHYLAEHVREGDYI